MSAPASASLRTRVIAVGVATTIVALMVAFFIVGSLGSKSNTKNQLIEDTAIAKVLASNVGSPPQAANLRTFHQLLIAEKQHVTVRTAAGTFSLGVPIERDVTATRASVPIAGGTLTVTSALDTSLDPPIEFVYVALAVLLVVLASVSIADRTLNRETRERVDQAVRAAERVSLGDFSVRVGGGGPEPIARLGRAFDTMAARLESFDRDQREFLADLAHEVATPIQALSGFAQAVIDGTVAKDVAQSMIESQTGRLSELLDELTQLRNIDTPYGAQLEDVDIEEVCRSLYQEFITTAQESGVVLNYRCEHMSLRTDQGLVEMVLRNFLTNAFRYTPSGESVSLRGEMVHDRVVLSVSDTGPGIAPEHQQRIFDRFYRTEEARDRISGGTGLGLTIARSAASSLGGHIELDSTIGQGSTFRLVVPARHGAHATSEVTTGGDAKRGLES
ncbi:MAG: HAMP domain-containing histidine kinase [Acidobacteria bacterium]|nr:HAMP domain-containing histidine kinase [Acidobacteriota bacterium]